MIPGASGSVSRRLNERSQERLLARVFTSESLAAERSRLIGDLPRRVLGSVRPAILFAELGVFQQCQPNLLTHSRHVGSEEDHLADFLPVASRHALVVDRADVLPRVLNSKQGAAVTAGVSLLLRYLPSAPAIAISLGRHPFIGLHIQLPSDSPCDHRASGIELGRRGRPGRKTQSKH